MTATRQDRWSHRLLGTSAGLALLVGIGACSTETGSGTTAAADDGVARAAVEALEESSYDRAATPSRPPLARQHRRVIGSPS